MHMSLQKHIIYTEIGGEIIIKIYTRVEEYKDVHLSIITY